MNRLKSLTTWRILALILLLAFGLRLINLGGRTLWYDEAFAVLFAEKGWGPMVDGTLTVVDDSAADVHPLVYYMSLNVWMEVFGQDVAIVRLYSVLIGTATVGVIFLLARDWFGAHTGLIAALIVALAPFHVQYSQETRMYALLGLTLMLLTWVYWRAIHRGHWAYWVIFGLLAGFGMYVQQLAAMYLLAIGLIPLLTRDWRRQLYTGLAALLALVIYLPWLLNLPDQLSKLREYWVEKPHILAIWLALRSFVSVNIDFSSTWWIPTFLLAALLTVLLLWRGIATLRARKGENREAVRWALWLAFMPVVFMWIASYIFQPIFLPRALVPSSLILYVALAWLFTRAAVPRPITAILALWWGIVIAFGLVTHYTWDTFPNGRFDDAVRYLADQRAPDDAIVHGNKITLLPMVYYERDLDHSLNQHYVRDIPGSGSDTLAVPTQETLGLLADECGAVAANGAPRVWYVAFEQFKDEMIELAKDDPTQARYDSLLWLRAHYTEAGIQQFNDLDVYLFTDPDAEALRATCE